MKALRFFICLHGQMGDKHKFTFFFFFNFSAEMKFLSKIDRYYYSLENFLWEGGLLGSLFCRVSIHQHFDVGAVTYMER
jgi:hypothetical protein